MNSDLSEREVEILRLVATGAGNKEIAQQLQISPNTVKVHLRNIFEKIGASSRTAASMYAIRNGLVEAPPPGATPSPPEKHPAPRWFWVLILLGVVLLALGGIFIWRQKMPQTAGFQATPSPPSRWSMLAPPPVGRSAGAAAVYENRFYLIGGQTANGTSADTLVYDPGRDQWQTARSKPNPVSQASAARLGEKLYVPGGLDAGGKPSDQLDIYDPRIDRWSSGARLPEALADYALAVFEGRLYLFGGVGPGGLSEQVYEYDPGSDAWTKRSALPAARRCAAAVAQENKIFLLGGANRSETLASTLIYYPQRDRQGETAWENGVAMPEGRCGSAATLLAANLFVAGGENRAGGLPTPLIQFSFGAQTWAELDPPPLTVGRYPALLPLENHLHLIDGKNHQAYQAFYTIFIPVVQ